MAGSDATGSRPLVEQAGYLELLRTNRNYRLLWMGSVVSLFGDWFNTIALYTVVASLTGSPLAIGAIFITKMLPWAIASPFAGVVVDRFDRRRLMIGADLLRAVIVLGFLLVDSAERVWLLYVLAASQVVVGSVFQPAKSASIPNITTPRELVTANAISSATWSALLALGAALGGFAAEFLGVRAVFVIDSATYVMSAGLIFLARIPQSTGEGGTRWIGRALLDITDGWRYLRSHVHVGRIALAKASWAIGGGGLVYMLALMGEQVAPGAQAMGIGLLFAARGLGTGVGPIIARAMFRDQSRWPLIMGSCVVASGMGYGVLAGMPWTLAVTAFVLFAHAASGANWVMATVLLQQRSEDRFRGRVFATEWLLVMAAESLSIILASILLETGVLDLRGCLAAFAFLQVLCGLIWLVTLPQRRHAPKTA
jgi:predicted MFS family arabinose efflux permease